MATNLTSKGQVTVPKKIRDYLGLRPGASVDFSLSPEGNVIVRAASSSKTSKGTGQFDVLRGTLSTGKNTDELMQLLRDYDDDIHDPGLE